MPDFSNRYPIYIYNGRHNTINVAKPFIQYNKIFQSILAFKKISENSYVLTKNRINGNFLGESHTKKEVVKICLMSLLDIDEVDII